MTTEQYIDHEVRMRVSESSIAEIKHGFKHLENKLDSQFRWTLGIIITLFGSMIVTKIFT
jgi:hypothetical protein